MKRAPIAAIARREVGEIISDWRMVVPLLVLMIVVPLLTLLALLMAVGVLGDPGWATSMLPLGLLLCGFLPAGFALINASESFVGEKERSTLESLLATPVTDRDIYFGKLAGALVLPMWACWIAVATLAISFALFGPATGNGLSAGLVAAILALATLKAIVLVAGALLISMAATTVRGANLLAAFILVPLGGLVNGEAYLLVSSGARLLWFVGGALAAFGLLLILRGATRFKRERVLAPEPAMGALQRVRQTVRRTQTVWLVAICRPSE